MFLSEGKVGEQYKVEKLSLMIEVQRRLEALGMTSGAMISVLNNKGDGILIIKLRGTRFALGHNITKNISVRRVA